MEGVILNEYFDLYVMFADGEERTFMKVNHVINKEGLLLVGVLQPGGKYKEIIAISTANIKFYTKEY
jgi:hypothetical protein